jgi:hypothetical protein
VALLIGYLGLSRFQLNASRTVNSHLVWSLDSRWFFRVSLVLGAASLALSVWNWWKASRRRASAPVTPGTCGDDP